MELIKPGIVYEANKSLLPQETERISYESQWDPFAPPLPRPAIPQDVELISQSFEFSKARIDAKSVLSDSEVEYLLGLAKGRDRQVVIDLQRRMLSRIRTETSYFSLDDRTRAGYKNFIDQGYISPVDVVHESPFVRSKKAGGVYLRDSNRIELADPCPDSLDIVSSLSHRGTLPLAVQRHTHELAHVIQDPMGLDVVEFKEAHASRTSVDYRRRLVHDVLVNRCLSRYPELGVELNANLLHAAVWAVDRLNALGFGHYQVMELLAKYQEKPEELFYKIADLAKERGLTLEDLDKKVISYELELATQQMKAKQIAREVLRDAFQEELDEKRRADDERQKRSSDRRRRQKILLVQRELQRLRY